MAVTVFDLDGVLADVRHRLHFLQQRPRDWKSFFADAVRDPVLEPGRVALEAAVEQGSDIMYLTGRPDFCRADTMWWFREHGFPEAELHMRPNRDRRPARYFKAESLQRFARTHPIAAMIDDDLKVVEHLRELGFTVLHATWMDEHVTGADSVPEQLDLLYEAQEEQGRT